MSSLAFVLACVALTCIQANRSNPIEKALQMITNLQSMVLTEANDAQKTYNRYALYCEERSRNIMYAIKTEKAEAKNLQAAIYSNAASIGVLNAKIEEVSSQISESDGQVQAAEAMREKEAEIFSKEKEEIADMIEALKRAISVISKKDTVELIQLNKVSSITQVLGTLVEASAMSAEDAFKLTSLVQEHHEAEVDHSRAGDDDEDAALESWSQNSFMQSVPIALAPHMPDMGGPAGPAPPPPAPAPPAVPTPDPAEAQAEAQAQAERDAAAAMEAAAMDMHPHDPAAGPAPPLAGGMGNMHLPLGGGGHPLGMNDQDMHPFDPNLENDPALAYPYEHEEEYHHDPNLPHDANDEAHYAPPSPTPYDETHYDGGHEHEQDHDHDFMMHSPMPAPTPAPPLRPNKQPRNIHIPEIKAKAYKQQSLGIVSTLENLLDKANAHFDELQGTEATALQKFQMLKASLQQGLEVTANDMTEAKTSIPEKNEAKSVAEGELQATSEDLIGDEESKVALKHECLSAAEEFQVAVKGRNQEMNALAAAKKAIQDTTGGAVVKTYLVQRSSVAFVQRISSTHHIEAPSNLRAVRLVRNLARSLESDPLAQLASRMSSAMQLGTTADPFSKVKDLLANMITKLSEDADGDASLKEYCDKEMSMSAEKKDDIGTENDRLSTHIEQKGARAAKLQAQISSLQRELAALTRAQAVISQIRQDEHRSFLKNKDEMEQGLRGIKLAVKFLRQHYGQDSQSSLLTEGASGGIIGLLEVVEADFAQGVAELIAEEEAAASHYESTVKPSSELEAAAKQHDMKLKRKEYISVSKAESDLSSDALQVSDKLNAVNEYEKILKAKCVKPDTYEERKSRREKEMAGLKEALTSLAGETMFLQTESTQAARLRGTQRHSP